MTIYEVEEKHKHFSRSFSFFTSAIIAFIVIVMIVMMLSMCISPRREMVTWNNGHCICGGQWEYADTKIHVANGHSWTTYLFACNQCNNMIELSWNPLQRN